MKRTLIAGVVLGLGLVGWSAWAEESGKPLSAEQQAQRKVLIQKYDTNRDGVLDNKEAKAMDKADKKALAKLGGVGTAKKGGEKVKPSATEKEKVEKKNAEKPKTTGAEPAKGGKGKGKK